MYASLLSLLALAAAVRAAITPTSPESATVVRAGSPINALWAKDTTGTWTNVQIQLMTGDNLNMVPLATVGTGIDGTTTESYAFNAPAVSPYSKIYFLQFTRGGDVSTATWTTRFTIAAPDGSTTAPTNTTTYSGVPVQWGTGVLAANGTTTSGNSSASAAVISASASGSTTSTMLSTSIAPVSSSTSASPSAVPSSSSSSSASSRSSSASGTTSATAAAATTSRSAAGRLEVVGLGAVVAGVIGVALL